MKVSQRVRLLSQKSKDCYLGSQHARDVEGRNYEQFLSLASRFFTLGIRRLQE